MKVLEVKIGNLENFVYDKEKKYDEDKHIMDNIQVAEGEHTKKPVTSISEISDMNLKEQFKNVFNEELKRLNDNYKEIKAKFKAFFDEEIKK